AGGLCRFSSVPFFFSDPAPTAIPTLSLQRRSSDLELLPQLPLEHRRVDGRREQPDRAALRPGRERRRVEDGAAPVVQPERLPQRSEEHTSELQSRENLVCRLLLEKKKQKKTNYTPT